MFLDFVYCGDFDLSSVSVATMNEVSRLLGDFLELLQIADEWRMVELKEKIEWNIIYKFDMIQQLPRANTMSMNPLWLDDDLLFNLIY